MQQAADASADRLSKLKTRREALLRADLSGATDYERKMNAGALATVGAHLAMLQRPSLKAGCSEASLDARARRVARKHRHQVVKSRKGFSVDNRGGFMLMDLDNRIVAGERFDLTAQAVIDYFR